MTTTTRSAAKNQDKQPSEARPAEEAEPGLKHKTEPEEHAKQPSPKRAKKEAEEERGKEEVEGESESRGEKKENEEGANTTFSAVGPQAHRGDTPANILEKGVIYFFFRGRVNVDDPASVADIARTYVVLRPIDRDAGLKGVRGDDQGGEKEGEAAKARARLLLVPKKTLPRTGRDRWVGFVDKADASLDRLRHEFLPASAGYETKTAGTRRAPPATPVGEGVYAITSTGRASHLVYLLTLPPPDSGGGGSGGDGTSRLGEVQRDLGLKERGSFVITTKNPEYPGPASARLPKGPDYPKELLDEFRSLRWVPTQPKHLDYVNTQVLLVGESSGTDRALEPQQEDQAEGKAEPGEEMERLEREDEERMRSLADDDADRIYADLQADAKSLPRLLTSFS
ncbi:hypothetical protein VTH06DRAFT_8687 [Thermothelomyces fergusii]